VKPIASHDRNQTLRARPGEAALLAWLSRSIATGTMSLVVSLATARIVG
jgi:hypothetical protein